MDEMKMLFGKTSAIEIIPGIGIWSGTFAAFNF